MNHTFLPSPALRPGDPVAIIAPCSPFDREAFERGLGVLARRYQPVFSPEIFSAERYLAGSDARRLEEWRVAFSDPGIRAVFCARGGYGAMRLLKALRVPSAPKPLVGFSDVTALHAVLSNVGLRSVHGPVVTQLGALGEAAARELFQLLESSKPPPAFRGRPLVPGEVEAPVLGGNLSLLTHLLGTPFCPPLDGAILFLEDVGERPYRLDRMIHHLELAGVFERVAGIALGAFTDCEDAQGSGADLVRELFSARALPCATDFPVGHGAINRPFVLGARARLDGTAGTLSFLEGVVE